MMTANRQLEEPNTLIAGLGITGISCARFLRRQGVPFRLVDNRDQPPQLEAFKKEFTDVEIMLGSFDKQALRSIETLILSPGIPLQHPFVELAKQKGLYIVGDIELFARHVNAPVIAITGSNGKSTVTTMVGHLLQACGYRVCMGGNLGTAALDLLAQPAPDFYVLELSSFQLDLVQTLQPVAAVVLNVSDDHMDRYAGMDEYAASKARIYRHAKTCILNKDDGRVRNMNVEGRPLWFSAAEPREHEFGLLERDGESWLLFGRQKLISAAQLRIQGRHNYLNALAALALLKAVDIEPDDAAPHMATFEGLSHRCQLVAEHNGVRWVNDSKATNVGAARAAIESFSAPLVLIAGGDGKGADFSELRQSIAEHVKAVILLGRDAALLQQTLADVAPCIIVKDMRQAVAEAAARALGGDTVLLAPACASLDMYSSYVARGEDFLRCVQEVIAHE